MLLRLLSAVVACIAVLNSTAIADMYGIKNPAEKISNPADRMYNPATKIDNPAANIYNPAGRMNNPDPLTPPTQAAPKPVATEVQAASKPVDESKDKSSLKMAMPSKRYHFKTAAGYINAAKKAFIKDNYIDFMLITEDALRRIKEGTLKASNKNMLQLTKFKKAGYSFLETSK